MKENFRWADLCSGNLKEEGVETTSIFTVSDRFEIVKSLS